jgi:hypothetical protein
MAVADFIGSSKHLQAPKSFRDDLLANDKRRLRFLI